jgi:sec-independent protein translocase protein TatA
MGGLSIWHLLIVLIIVLFFFGPRKLPELGKGLGEAIRGFKKGLEGEEIDVTESSQKREQLRNSSEQNATQKQKANSDSNEA